MRKQRQRTKTGNFMAITLLCILLYFATNYHTNQQLTRISVSKNTIHPKAPLIVFSLAIVVHFFVIYFSAFSSNEQMNLNFKNTLIIIGVLFSLATVVLYLLKNNLGLILAVAAFNGLVLIISLFLPDAQHTTNSNITIHAGLSFSAYVLLGLAACQAVIISYVHKHMRNKTSFGIIRNLPPIIEMEKMLFITITLGFILLTLALGSGFIHLDNMFEQDVAHKAVFSIVSWLLFAGLLTGRFFQGWRGKKAIRWTLIAFGLLFLAFLGTQFIKEVILR